VSNKLQYLSPGCRHHPWIPKICLHVGLFHKLKHPPYKVFMQNIEVPTLPKQSLAPEGKIHKLRLTPPVVIEEPMDTKALCSPEDEVEVVVGGLDAAGEPSEPQSSSSTMRIEKRPEDMISEMVVTVTKRRH
jgi:hypothetical protein